MTTLPSCAQARMSGPSSDPDGTSSYLSRQATRDACRSSRERLRSSVATLGAYPGAPSDQKPCPSTAKREPSCRPGPPRSSSMNHLTINVGRGDQHALAARLARQLWTTGGAAARPRSRSKRTTSTPRRRSCRKTQKCKVQRGDRQNGQDWHEGHTWTRVSLIAFSGHASTHLPHAWHAEARGV